MIFFHLHPQSSTLQYKLAHATSRTNRWSQNSPDSRATVKCNKLYILGGSHRNSCSKFSLLVESQGKFKAHSPQPASSSAMGGEGVPAGSGSGAALSAWLIVLTTIVGGVLYYFGLLVRDLPSTTTSTITAEEDEQLYNAAKDGDVDLLVALLFRDRSKLLMAPTEKPTTKATPTPSSAMLTSTRTYSGYNRFIEHAMKRPDLSPEVLSAFLNRCQSRSCIACVNSRLASPAHACVQRTLDGRSPRLSAVKAAMLCVWPIFLCSDRDQ